MKLHGSIGTWMDGDRAYTPHVQLTALATLDGRSMAHTSDT